MSPLCRNVWLAPLMMLGLVLLLTASTALRAEDRKQQDLPPAAQEDRYAVPEGDVQALLDFIEKIRTFRPTTTAEALQHRQKATGALTAAAEKILELEKDKSSAAYQAAQTILLQGRAQSIGNLPVAQQRQTLADLKALFATRKELTAEDFNLAFAAARGLEYSSAPRPLAAEAYNDFAETFSKSDDAQIANYAEMFSGAARRLTLVGNAMELAGTQMDGTTFDLASLKGKVVLIDFWATWCGPCLAEYPNIKKNYEKYHEAGFEVVGVSLDQNRAALEKYLQDKGVAWITLHEQEAGGQNPATRQYGIFGIPTMILVGRDGKVISTRARGEELNRLLAKEFGSDS